ncbi:hypothetical protein GCM10022394_17350 [Zobellella aerophila]|uniref:Uncharacterized protein n=1 Tax=Zobellella aerophila TaxID=870480 RepID=A0ABP6VNP7_9GAMM
MGNLWGSSAKQRRPIAGGLKHKKARHNGGQGTVHNRTYSKLIQWPGKARCNSLKASSNRV